MADERPNILLYTTDQQRGDHISISGHPVVETPNVDAFLSTRYAKSAEQDRVLRFYPSFPFFS